MAYPGAANLSNQLKLRTIEAASTSSGTVVLSVVVPFRGKLLNAIFATGGGVGQTASATIDFTQTAGALSTAAAILGSTIAGMGQLSVTTTTGGSFVFGPPTTVTYVSQGDILSLSSTGTAGSMVSWIIGEF